MRWLYIAIALLSAAGLIISAIALQRHYSHSATSFCELSTSFNCDIVNRSEYSRIAGIPVAALGIVGYGLLMYLSLFRRADPLTPTLLRLFAVLGFLFAVYLTYIEAYVLTTWCILCLGSLAAIFTITILAGILKWRAGSAR